MLTQSLEVTIASLEKHRSQRVHYKPLDLQMPFRIPIFSSMFSVVVATAMVQSLKFFVVGATLPGSSCLVI